MMLKKLIQFNKHSLEPGHVFDRDFKLIVIEEIIQRNMTKEQMHHTLLNREDFWILKLGTLEPEGFNDKLNFPAQHGSTYTSAQ